MTKKHLIAAAKALLNTKPHTDPDAYARLVNDLADTFAAVNPAFQRGRFLTACGL